MNGAVAELSSIAFMAYHIQQKSHIIYICMPKDFTICKFLFTNSTDFIPFLLDLKMPTKAKIYPFK